jgi:hypothetical protein
MRKCFLVALGVTLVASALAVDADARPGGKRAGGARVGGAGPGNVRSGSVRPGGQVGQQGAGNSGGKLESLAGTNGAASATSGNLQNKASQLKTNFTTANQPFTPAWYANHPQAWRYRYPHADAWAVARFGTAAAWLGLAATDNVYTSEETTAEDASDDGQADEQGEFLPLGVFALAPPSEKNASVLVELAVSKEGEVRGNYYDVLSGQEQPIQGRLDKQTQKATFTAGSGGKVTFETTLASLTKPTGSVTLRFENGQTRKWALARFDDAQGQQTGG